MERNEPLIRWSPNPRRDEFMSINLNYRIVQLYQATGHALPENFEFRKIAKHNEFPSLSAFDWSPAIRGLVAVGNSRGEINLLRVDDDSNAALTLPLKLQRNCQALAFNTTGLLAVGLDRVRNDSCLQIWDVNQRLADWDPKQKGWGGVSVPTLNLEPRKLEASLSVTSIRFFEDQPQTLVVGIKNQCVRIHDLRDPNSAVISFSTRCNNNLAIDYADQNYFASSSLDQPGVVVWDRRATQRSVASPMYLESIDEEGVPWGASLKLDHAIESENNVYIRHLRYCRDQRGHLGVLSNMGQLQVFHTTKEYIEPGSTNDIRGSPELLEVKKSRNLEYPYFDPDHKQKYEDRIVSFDWLSLSTSEIPGRVVVLRANGNFEILQLPASTAGLLSNLIPWRPPHRQDETELSLLRFNDLTERATVLGPLFETQVRSGIPVFGPDSIVSENAKSDVEAKVREKLQSAGNYVTNLQSTGKPNIGTTSQIESLGVNLDNVQLTKESTSTDVKSAAAIGAPSTIASILLNDLPSNDMLSRAKAGYLFDCKLNRKITTSEYWLSDVWEWIEGAEEAIEDDGMISGSLDLSYMGVYTIWNNILGEKANSRLIDSTIIPDVTQWEGLIASINKRAGRPNFKSIHPHTTKPHHRQLCLAICGLAQPTEEFDNSLKALEDEGKITTAAAWALFEGNYPRAAQSLAKSGDTELVGIAMALAVKQQSNLSGGPIANGWGAKPSPRMARDPYLRAIWSYVMNGSWTEIVNEAESPLPLRDRVGIALRYFTDNELTDWLSEQMADVIENGRIEGIVLAGITDSMTDILAKYVEKSNDSQTPILVMSFCYPRYIDDIRCSAWRNAYKAFLQRHKEFILRVRFEQQSTIKSRTRDGTPTIPAPPRQVTIRCLKCDANIANDLDNSGAPPVSAPGPAPGTMRDQRNPLAATGINAGLCCPKCGSHLPRCAICMEPVGVPRSDRPELSNDPAVKRMANFPSFCMKCKHVSHMDHAIQWFGRHVECPVSECRCQCNERPGRESDMY